MNINEYLKDYKLVESYIFEHNGVKILLDVNTSNFFEVNDVIYDVIAAIQGENSSENLLSNHSEEDINQAIADLKENNFLVNEIPEYEKPVVPEDAEVNNLVINICHDCNLRCKYCFASTGSYKGERSLMNEDVAIQTVDWYFKQSGESKALNLQFFGGEPLMNVPLIKKIIVHADELAKKYDKTIYYSMSTNGTILNDEILQLVKDHNIGIQISIDGPPEIHDKYRITENGGGSYDMIKENIKTLLKELPASQVIPRATVPPDAIKINKIVNHLFDLGFKIVFFVPAMGCGKYVISENNFDEIEKEYNQLAETFIEKYENDEEYNVYPFSTEVDVISKGIKRAYGCGSGIGFMNVAMNGDLYPCMRFTNREEYRLGNVFDGIDNEKRKMFFNRTVEDRHNCKKCWARYFCGGACISIPTESGNGLLGSDVSACEVAKHVTKLAMYTNCVLTRDGKPFKNDNKEIVDFIRRRLQ